MINNIDEIRTNFKDPISRIIVALDTSDKVTFTMLVEQLARYGIRWFKVGLEALTAKDLGYERSIGIIKDAGAHIFLDAKLHDIGETLKKTSLNLVRHTVDMINVHTVGASKGSLAAVKENAGNAIVLGVTLLTDISNEECIEDFHESSSAIVKRMAMKAEKVGLDGLICSAADLQSLSESNIATGMLRVTPGIRPLWASANDQKRVLTPKMAIEAGADFLVIGRPITDPPPEVQFSRVAINLILEEIGSIVPTN